MRSCSALTRLLGTRPEKLFSASWAIASRRRTHDLPTSGEELCVSYDRGLPTLRVPLPSRNERVQFTLKPVNDNVGDLCRHIREEDKGIDVVSVLSPDGTRIAQSTPIYHLLHLRQFQLRINDQTFQGRVADTPPDTANVNETLADVRSAVAGLYATLNVDEHQVKVEQALVKRIEDLQTELAPLERTKERMAREASQRSNRWMWAGMAAMGCQFGLFARLTWWEYSWDIMEPVTYFATYSIAIASFAYYLVTRQVYEYPDAQGRIFLKKLYGMARKQNFDMPQYNQLKLALEKAEEDLRRLRDPSYLNLPLHKLQAYYQSLQ